MTDLRPAPSTTCQACTLIYPLAKCATCEFAPEERVVDFNPATMTRATAEDVARMYAILWPIQTTNKEQKMNKNQITNGLNEIGACWAVTTSKTILPNDGWEAKPAY